MNSTAKIGTVAGAAGVALLSILIGLPLLVVAGEGGHPSASGAQGLESVGVPPIAAQAYERAPTSAICASAHQLAALKSMLTAVGASPARMAPTIPPSASVLPRLAPP